MSTYTRARTRRQQMHPGSRGESHKADMAAAKDRKLLGFIPVREPHQPIRARPLQDYGISGYEMIYDGTRWRRCADPEEFPRYLVAEAGRRNWFYRQTRRGGKIVKMRRTAGTPIEVITTTFSPAFMGWCHAQLEAGSDPRWHLTAVRNKWIAEVHPVIQEQRFVLGVAGHHDSSVAHIDYLVSRQRGDGERIGRAGLLMVGPWCAAVDRQIRFGAKIGAEKRCQFETNIANFHRRYGTETEPLDLRLARTLDAVCDQVIGPDLDRFRAEYAAQVPAREHAYILAKIGALDEARKGLEKQLETVRTSPPLEREIEPDRTL